MNMISFANFDKFGNQNSFFPNAEPDEKTEDFSMILSNIVVALQSPDLPVKSSTNEPNADFNVLIPNAPKQEIMAGNLQTDDNLLELPAFGQFPFKPSKFETFPELPTGQTLWAGGEGIRQRLDQYKSALKADQKIPVPINEILPIETAETVSENQTIDILPTAPSVQPLWAGGQGIRQRLTEFKSEIKSNQKLTQNLDELFQAEIKPKTDKPEILPTPGEPVKTAPKTESAKLPFFKPAQPAENLTLAPQVFPAIADSGKTDNSKLETLALDSQKFTTKPSEVEINPEITKNEINDFDARRETSDFQTAQKFSLNVETKLPVAEPNVAGFDSNPTDLEIAPNPPEILLKPKYVDNKLTGVDPSPNEIHSILGTFDRLQKKAGIKANAVETVRQNTGANDNFFAAQTNRTQNLWWNAQPSNDKNPKTGFAEFPQSINFSDGEILKPETGLKNSDQNGQLNFDNFVKTTQPERFIFEQGQSNRPPENSSQQNFPEIRLENSEIKTLENAEVQPNDSEIDVSVKFDKLFETISNSQKLTATVQKSQTEPAQIAEQINPHLLELAALADKKNEKQTLRMRLHPAELGTIEIKLERNDSGTLNAYFKTETDGARAALTSNLEQLRETLQNAGWQIGQMEITNSPTASTANQHRENNQRQSESVENYNFSRSSETPDELEPAASNRLLSLLA